jgi:hypothetical protein
MKTKKVLEEGFFVDNCFITNRPLIWTGKGKSRKQIPDTSVEITEAYLLGFKVCKNKKKKMNVEFIKGKNEKDVYKKIKKFIRENDAKIVEEE